MMRLCVSSSSHPSAGVFGNSLVCHHLRNDACISLTEDHQQRICELETTLLGLEQSLNKLEHRNESLQHQLTSTSAAAAAAAAAEEEEEEAHQR